MSFETKHVYDVDITTSMQKHYLEVLTDLGENPYREG